MNFIISCATFVATSKILGVTQQKQIDRHAYASIANMLKEITVAGVINQLSTPVISPSG